MAPHSSTLAWEIPWMEEPGRLQPMGSLRVGHDWATSLSLFTVMHWRRKWQPTPVFLPGESQGQRSLVGCRLWVTQSWTRLTWLSSSSRIDNLWTWLPLPQSMGDLPWTLLTIGWGIANSVTLLPNLCYSTSIWIDLQLISFHPSWLAGAGYLEGWKFPDLIAVLFGTGRKRPWW